MSNDTPKRYITTSAVYDTRSDPPPDPVEVDISVDDNYEMVGSTTTSYVSDGGHTTEVLWFWRRR